jgi:hypothetical protein
MNDNNWILGFVNRPYKLQRCDTYDKRYLPVPGDLIGYVRGPFPHWAVYLGYNRIAHLPGLSNLFANFQVGKFSSYLTDLLCIDRSVKQFGEYYLVIESNQCKLKYVIFMVFFHHQLLI